MGIDRDEIDSRVTDRADDIDDRLEHIPNSTSMPNPEDMTIGTAKEFRLGIVFLDIAGFTEYASNNDYKDVLFMLNLFIPEVIEVARGMGGAFEKNTGDGILVYFGSDDDDDTIAHDVLEYLATVKTILADYVNPTLTDHGVETVSIKAGAAMGTTYISRIGAHGLNRRTAVGTTANIASKLEDKANTNEYFVYHGIHKHANEGGSMWAEYLYDKGSFGSYTWGSDSDGWEDGHYYDFRGGWEGINWDNLK